MELTALKGAVLFLLREKREECGSALKSIQVETAKGHDMKITLSEALEKMGRIEGFINALENREMPERGSK